MHCSVELNAINCFIAQCAWLFRNISSLCLPMWG